MDIELQQWTKSSWSVEDYHSLIDYMFSIQDEAYRDFHQKLVPGVEHLIGIRSPQMRALAKVIAKGDFIGFLNLAQQVGVEGFLRTFRYYDENLLQGLVIGSIPAKKVDFDEVVGFIRKFVPFIDNWAVCDMFCSSLGIKKKYHAELFPLVLEYYGKPGEYERRFSVVMMMEYVEDAYIETILDHLFGLSSSFYYVQMATAWTISVCFVKYQNKTMDRLEQARKALIAADEEEQGKRFIFNKSISKIIESRRVDQNTKDFLKSLKIHE